MNQFSVLRSPFCSGVEQNGIENRERLSLYVGNPLPCHFFTFAVPLSTFALIDRQSDALGAAVVHAGRWYGL